MIYCCYETSFSKQVFGVVCKQDMLPTEHFDDQVNQVSFKGPLEILFRPLWVLQTAEKGRTNKKEPQSKAALVREVIMNVLAIDE